MYQGNLVAYFRKNEATLRYILWKDVKPTDINSLCRIKENKRDSKIVNSQIDELEERIDAVVDALLMEDHYARITNKVVKGKLHPRNAPQETIKTEETGVIMYDFPNFIKAFNVAKLKEDEERGIVRKGKVHPTTKDYISTMNALQDYEHDNSVMLRLSDFDDNFMEEFVEYLLDERPTMTKEEKRTADYVYASRGGLNNATINKRLDCLSYFVKRQYGNEEVASKIKSVKLDATKLPDIVCLERDELVSLADMPLESPEEERIRDYFVFDCLTGLRFADFVKVTKVNITKRQNHSILSIYTQKNSKFAEVPLVDRAKAIAEKYHYDFGYYTNQAINRGIKNLFEKYHLFEDNFPLLRRVKKKIITVPKLRRERLSFHAGRRTFISMLVQGNTPTNILMGYTGHTKVETLKHYISKYSSQSFDYIKQLNF